ncbi:hypothetical protein [Variovorax sp. MHTC-1]|uniref:hypothetical protein n=2 Tax=Variovorax TaxID=34072 RepID=UPI000F881E04|nr:hypothetical protein [Variovorax sp. MHTC-1]RST47882.1 hypothetical protein EJI01_27555 [Variovorax sp. MHTC-1]
MPALSEAESRFFNLDPGEMGQMEMEEVNARLRSLELRAVAQTAAIAVLLQEQPNASAKLHLVAEHLVDAPPIPMSDEDLVKVAAYIQAMLGGPWID